MDNKLCESIQKNLEAQGISLSDQEIKNLYISTVQKLYDLTDEGEVIDIPDFGSFWKKKTEQASVSLFSPKKRLTDRINKEDE
ncbi:hypothetical protein [Dysgonomonas macrotermitis]|uniref:HU family DNA-binding protein n=1 Tax=Dysgonomonas macrotermitis TaxID=1346286 RepID=A0A1M4ZI16_9BACT|nr:hypothetical protein [Dysgonomonas macrotermitis]SHF17684.1 hypothetical protein SAMN05444362_10495 [Dysgonomonas macrotermitis]